MKKARALSLLFVLALLAVAVIAQAQQPKAYLIGVITGGGAYYQTIDGLRAGLKQFGV
jgi:hypothetical protein